MKFVNTTDTSFCYYRDEAALGYCGEVKPGRTAVWRPGCGYGEQARERHLTVVLTVTDTGKEIYNKTAACFEWQDARATFVIEERDTEFVVTDNVPVDRSTP